MAVISAGRPAREDRPRAHVDLDVPEAHGARRLGFARGGGDEDGRAAQGGADAGQELGEAERLGDVVLGAELEPRHLVHLAAPRRQDDDGHHPPLASKRLEHLEAVHLGEHHVEDDEIGSVGPREVEAPLAVLGHEDPVPLPLEIDAKTQGDAGVVLHDEHRRLRLVTRPAETTHHGSVGALLPLLPCGGQRREQHAGILLPCPTALSTSIRARCARAMLHDRQPQV